MRVLIVCDENENWYVRRVRAVEHATDTNEKIYHCDLPIGDRFETLGEACAAARRTLGEQS